MNHKQTLSPKQSGHRPDPHETALLYQRMRDENLLSRVVQGDESFSEFQSIAADATFQTVRDTAGTIAGFWWLSQVYGTVCAFHFCLFRPYRSQAADLFRVISNKIFSVGVSAIMAFTNVRHHDLTRFCRAAGFKHIETINKELNVWVVEKTA